MDDIVEQARDRAAGMGWQSMDSALKGGGAELTTDPGWVDPPRILLLFEGGKVSVAYWDWYYADGGDGCRNGFAWIEPCSSEQLDQHYGQPTHWKPLDTPGTPDPTAALLTALADEVERLREALNVIAAYNDTQASFHLGETGSYALFDEPGSVEIARLALAGEKGDG